MWSGPHLAGRCGSCGVHSLTLNLAPTLGDQSGSISKQRARVACTFLPRLPLQEMCCGKGVGRWSLPHCCAPSCLLPRLGCGSLPTSAWAAGCCSSAPRPLLSARCVHPQPPLHHALWAAVLLGTWAATSRYLNGMRPRPWPPVLQLQEGEGAAHSSSIGPLVEEAQRLLSSFPGWIARRVEPALTAEAAQLARTALWPSPSLSGATAGAGEEKRATISQVKVGGRCIHGVEVAHKGVQGPACSLPVLL